MDEEGVLYRYIVVSRNFLRHAVITFSMLVCDSLPNESTEKVLATEHEQVLFYDAVVG